MSKSIIASKEEKEVKFTWANWSAKYAGLDLVNPGEYENLIITDWYNVGYDNVSVHENQTPQLNQYVLDKATGRVIGRILINRNAYEGLFDEHHFSSFDKSNIIAHSPTDMSKISIEKELSILFAECAYESASKAELLKLIAKLSSELKEKSFSLRECITNQDAWRGDSAISESRARFEFSGDNHLSVTIEGFLQTGGKNPIDKLSAAFPNNYFLMDGLRNGFGRLIAVSKDASPMRMKYQLSFYDSYLGQIQQKTFVNDITNESMLELLDGYNGPEVKEELAAEIIQLLNLQQLTNISMVSRNRNGSESTINIRAMNDKNEEVSIFIPLY